jgi:hypothetical protein
MNKITISGRIDPGWHKELTEAMQATGQSQSQILEEAIGAYLKKVTRLKVGSRLDAAEASIANLRELVLQVADQVFETPSV